MCDKTNLTVGQKITLSDLCDEMNMQWGAFETFISHTDNVQCIDNFDGDIGINVTFELFEQDAFLHEMEVEITDISEL